MHKMESGTPHAKYVVIEKVLGEWTIEQISVPYNWEEVLDWLFNKKDMTGHRR